LPGTRRLLDSTEAVIFVKSDDQKCLFLMIKGGFGVVPYLPYHDLYYHNSEK